MAVRQIVFQNTPNTSDARYRQINLVHRFTVAANPKPAPGTSLCADATADELAAIQAGTVIEEMTSLVVPIAILDPSQEATLKALALADHATRQGILNAQLGGQSLLTGLSFDGTNWSA